MKLPNFRLTGALWECLRVLNPWQEHHVRNTSLGLSLSIPRFQKLALRNFALLYANYSLRKSKVFALQILRPYLTKEGRARKFFYCLYG